MGELQPPGFPPERLIPLKPDLGQRELAEWNGEKRNTPYLPALSQTLQMNQGIERFQRRLRGFRASITTLVGEFPRFTVVVPESEAWLVRYIQIVNMDNALANFTVNVQPGRITTIGAITVMRVGVPAGRTKLIYPTDEPLLATADNANHNLRAKFELFDLDTVVIASGDVAIQSLQELMFWYELIPNRRNSSVGTPWTAESI